MDVRLLREILESEKGKEVNTLACLDWAFAGKSHAEPQGARQNGLIKLSHTVWDHWIDSKTDDPGVDAGDMWMQKNGDVLERGKQKNPETGDEMEYEELWHDVEVESFGKKQNRSSLVIRAEDAGKGVKGLAVKIGGFCQAIMKSEGDITVERWEHKPADFFQGQDPVHGLGDHERTHNDWIRTFRIGKGCLPCEYMVTNTTGKAGLKTVIGESVRGSWTTQIESWKTEIEWRVVEEYYW